MLAKTASKARAESLRAEAALEQARAEKRIAEENAALARRRGELFEKLLPWLQEHAAEGVLKYAQSLVKQGQELEALSAYAAFCDLALGDRQGFLTHELLQLDPLDLETLDLDEERYDGRWRRILTRISSVHCSY